MKLRFSIVVFFQVVALLAHAQNKAKTAPLPEIKISAGQCSEAALGIVADIVKLNGDGVATTSDGRGHSLEPDVPEAIPLASPENSESWQVIQEYKRTQKSGKVLMRRVVYDVTLIAHRGGFCSILQVQRISKEDFFRESK